MSENHTILQRFSLKSQLFRQALFCWDPFTKTLTETFNMQQSSLSLFKSLLIDNSLKTRADISRVRVISKNSETAAVPRDALKKHKRQRQREPLVRLAGIPHKRRGPTALLSPLLRPVPWERDVGPAWAKERITCFNWHQTDASPHFLVENLRNQKEITIPEISSNFFSRLGYITYLPPLWIIISYLKKKTLQDVHEDSNILCSRPLGVSYELRRV